ncbi:MAG: chromosome segregation protein SMC [Phycisphaerae bacterium]|nr:chromosome segregation protein SMC [Phycisphaerae bacterium]
MRLAKLTLSGFKSFADTTEFRFDLPIIGVVGPNGCGKSNVVDAIKWVLGERSAKSLRGGAMLDVIFAGSASRKPSGMASVTLSFENPVVDEAIVKAERSRASGGIDHDEGGDETLAEAEATATAVARVTSQLAASQLATAQLGDHEASIVRRSQVTHRRLPIDADEVDVTRRLYADGRSEYLINAKKVRLRDIRELFLDTGIGNDAYSIIEQGKVDAMLFANPTERRAILEEAAGVAKFRARKLEASRKLEHAEKNLVVLREQLTNTERRLRIVRGQAEKAERWQVLDTRRREVRTALAFDLYHELVDRLYALTSELSSLTELRDRSFSNVSTLEESKTAAEIRRAEVQREHHALEQRRLELTGKIAQARQRAEYSERALTEARRSAADESRRMAELEAGIAQCSSRIAEAEQAVATCSEAAADAERAVAAASEERARASSAALEAKAVADRLRDALGGMERDRSQLTGRSASLEARGHALAEQRTKLANRRDPFARELDGHRVARCAALIKGQVADDAIHQVQRELDDASHVAAQLGDRHATLAASLARMRDERTSLESRRRVLDDLQRSREGLGDAVKAIIEARDQYPAVRGLLADLIETDRGHADLVEAALGEKLELLLVDSLGAIVPAIATFLALDGRAAFAPIDIPARERIVPLLANSADGTMAGATHILDYVRAEGVARGVLESLLGTTFVVDDLDSALLLTAGPLSGCRIVTRTGELIEADGTLVLHPAETGDGGAGYAGVLQRRAELVELVASLSTLSLKIASLELDASQVASESGQQKVRLRELGERLQESRRAQIDANYQSERLDQLIRRIEHEGAAIEAEDSELAARAATNGREREQLAERVASIERLIGEERSKSDDARTAAEHAIAAVNAASDASGTARARLGEANGQLDSARRERRSLQASLDQSQREAQSVREQCERRGGQIERIESDVVEAAADVTASERDTLALAPQFDEVSASMRAASADVERVAGELASARSVAAVLERNWHSVEMSRREVEIKRENLEEGTLREVELDVAAGYAAHRDSRASPEFVAIDRDAAEREISDLRMEIKRLGNVNLDAIEELGTLEQKNAVLETQLIDIDQAKAQLEALITKLDDVSRSRFEETFKAVREHFAGQDGMFRRLFGGGSADLFLLPFEDGPRAGQIDWLESGVEIRAKPPGKEPRVISQLSGGEKTMTAVALLMAIFQSKPSPFCVLDEVDAALDESNVERFCATLKQFLHQSHFIVITHHKRTMQSCDMLYGITMPQRGVSKRVAVKFEEVAADGKLSKAATERAERETAASPIVEVDSDAIDRALTQQRLPSTALADAWKN